MPLTVVPELKKITPFIRRAEELDKDKANPESRLVAYYCRQYAVSLGIGLAKSGPAQNCLADILNQLEKEKEAMSVFSREEARYLCKEFCTKIFDKADGEDRAGAAGKGTAKTFYAAASFFEMLGQFYDTDDNEEREEQKKKIVYCKWKATEILKALKEGRTPAPGGYGEQQQDDDDNNNEGLAASGGGEQGEKQASESPETGAETDFVVPAAPSFSPPAPKVSTVTNDDDDDDDGVVDKGGDDMFPNLPSVEPMLRPALPPKGNAADDDNNDRDEDGVPEAGTEIELGPPPAYPGGDSAKENGDVVYVPDLPSPPRADKPPVAFKPAPPPASKPKKSGFFGLGSKKSKPSKKTAEKQAIEDALELARFAVAAVEDKDADLAATRLQQALSVLGR